MMKKLKATLLASILCLSTLAVACGGGGNSGSSTPVQSGSSQSETSSLDSSSVVFFRTATTRRGQLTDFLISFPIVAAQRRERLIA